MKKAMMLIVLILVANAGFAQNFKEWFRQKKTQKQYLIEQIAQLKVYLELTKKGYKIAKEGLTTISDIKRSEFKMHKNRFDSLLIVNPNIGSYGRLKQITDLHGKINNVCEKMPAALAEAGVFDQDQLAYFERVLAVLYQDCQHILGNLFLVIRNNNVAMTDDERILRIELCFRQMQDNYSFARSFEQSIKVSAEQVNIERTEIKNSRALHGIN
ncbi:hypothetical protein [Dyadobacter sp. 3J3]|uniref:hypothetical protein n=1 Tax=Dyadobacter sp. 3J3 TaxID=2606600 RepID=UPI0013568620|nr:hypothetical protein [Dyadobacter sp. 3J3]